MLRQTERVAEFQARQQAELLASDMKMKQAGMNRAARMAVRATLRKGGSFVAAAEAAKRTMKP